MSCNDSSSNAALHVASHYNARPELGIERRQESKIIRLRKFNNWVKAILIAKHTMPGDRALDIGCGKGGDIGKWSLARVSEYVGIDIADVSIEQAKERMKDHRNKRFNAQFHALDCYKNPIRKVLPQGFVADVISMQFCMHYAFETEQSALQMIRNVAENLRPGGRFIGTIPNANWLVKKVRSSPDLSFGNSIYRVEFDKKTDFQPFGHRYRFTLEDAVDDCPEYLVNFHIFQRMAEAHGLQLVFKQTFHEYYQSLMGDQENVNKLYAMGVVSDNGTSMSHEEWEAAGKSCD
ncbi:guanine-N(7)-methyltransferase domain-containing protein [Dimargaris cristalligena]|uniref:mRNA cap guanine-N(7) methyltransferase n=1 Tax=Dimargaris cristalligena TaxID=215637 RepID=A0A4P9ZRT7_9FUNG|nr:guanine-N(7)-methyltransferase domain-containing protein [Dimargaris cristalligena]|eukprot:RKP36127.1 guanine-N(7)-methyltransferase domain-containing protein [Dimargaris cristalligena]